jgi:hypothetical protein
MYEQKRYIGSHEAYFSVGICIFLFANTDLLEFPAVKDFSGTPHAHSHSTRTEQTTLAETKLRYVHHASNLVNFIYEMVIQFLQPDGFLPLMKL